MNFLRHEKQIDGVVPGVTAIYRQLRSSNGQGLYTSLGRYYNHTIFGRDSGMGAKFVTYFDHDIARQTILTLASYQGQSFNSRTMEAPGKIHHEMRDYSLWHGRWYDRLGLEIAGAAWGKKNRKLVSYYAADTTATYIRLINKYAKSIDASIIDRQVPRQDGSMTALAQSVAEAANWLVSQVGDDGIFWTHRTNRWSLPYQTFADSVTAYAWSDGSPADSAKSHSFIEAQAYALDALGDAIRLLPRHSEINIWKQTVARLRNSLLNQFWDETRSTFSPAIFERNGQLEKLDTDMITVAWILNASFWDDMPETQRQQRIEAIVRRIFADDFMTEFGVRSKSLNTQQPLGEAIDYHGSQTIWPMFNFMVIEGLRRHGLYQLARQIEFRLINTINALGNFPEFFIVDHEAKLYRPDSHAKQSKSGQMIPEQDISFTVVPMITLAYRHSYPRHVPATSGWQFQLESDLLAKVPKVDLLGPEVAKTEISAQPLKIKRTKAGLRSALHIAPVILGRNG